MSRQQGNILDPRWLGIIPILCILVFAPALLAHALDGDDPGPQNLHELWRTWGFEPGIVIGLAITVGLYAIGLWKLWRSAGIGHGIRPWEAWCYTGGCFILFIALVSPIHPLGEVLFSAHMVQHELLMLIATPLLVLGRPMIAFLRALPPSLSGALGRFSNLSPWKSFWSMLSAPLSAWAIHFIVLWGWHAPALFQATLTNEWVHAAQHISFIAASLLFWWSIFHGHRGQKNEGAAVLSLFTTAIHSGLLGALLTFSHSTWYPAYDDTQSWGLTGLEDQQLGGLIMWVPACTAYIVVALVLFAKWLGKEHTAPAFNMDVPATSK